jgi:hypothetical protein
MIYTLCAQLGDAERKRDGAWMSRFLGRDLGWKGPTDELYADELRAARALLSQMGIDAGVTDLPWLPQATSGRGST